MFKDNSLIRHGYHPIEKNKKMHLDNVPCSITMAEALALVDNKEELWEENKSYVAEPYSQKESSLTDDENIAFPLFEPENE